MRKARMSLKEIQGEGCIAPFVRRATTILRGVREPRPHFQRLAEGTRDKPFIRGVLVGGILAGAISLAPQAASAQSQLDISACFNPLLQQQVDYTSDERLALATFAQISESNYEGSTHDAGLTAKFKLLSLGLSYSEFTERRSEYFRLNRLDLQEYKSISLKTRTLDQKSYELIRSCITDVAATQYGLKYLTVIDERGKATVQFFWNPTDTTSRIRITDSALENATAVGVDAPKGKVYPRHRWYDFFSSAPMLERASPPILLVREDACKPIRISITTDPAVRIQPITIPPVPKPAVDLVCTSSIEKINPVTGGAYTRREVVDLVPLLVGPLGYGCPDCRKFEVVFDAPGPVLSATCANTSNWTHLESCQWDGKTVRATGFLNAGPARLIVDVAYGVVRQACTFPPEAIAKARAAESC